MTSISTPDGNGSEQAVTKYGYDADGEQTTAIPPDGNVPNANSANFTTVTAYNADGLTSSSTDAGGQGATVTPRVTSYGYDADGNQVSVTDPRGYATTTTYDAADEPTVVTDPLGNSNLTCYDANGIVSQTVPPAGVAANNLTAAACPVDYPAGYGHRLASDATTYTLDANGNATVVTTPAPAGQTGHETITTTYNGDGNPTTTTGPPASNGGPNQVTVDSYDAKGQLTSETDGYGTADASTTTYCYDPNGDQTAVIVPNGNAHGTAPCNTNPSYPNIVDPTIYTAQAAYQTTFGYGSDGDPASVTRPATSAAPNGATTTLTYDSAGDLATTTVPNGVTTTYSYTPTDDLASVS
jgi:YD repeat-containing protein